MNLPKKWMLAVDDSSDDLFWVQRAIDGALKDEFSYHLSQARDAQEARLLLMAIMKECVDKDEIVIFSDVNMPCESGLQLLEWLKGRPEYHHIPVVILSSFERRTEIIRAFELGAVACMFKPPEVNAVRGLLRTINELQSIKKLWGPDDADVHRSIAGGSKLSSAEIRLQSPKNCPSREGV